MWSSSKTVPGFSKKNKWQALSQEENPLKRNVIHYCENKAHAIVAKPVVEFCGYAISDKSAFLTEFTNRSKYSGVRTKYKINIYIYIQFNFEYASSFEYTLLVRGKFFGICEIITYYYN